MARKIDGMVVHCSDSAWGSVMAIDAWHRARGFKCIGYHFVILSGYITAEDHAKGRYMRRLDGALQVARPIDGDPFLEAEEVGAHASAMGFNHHTVGMCLIGRGGQYSPRQMLTAYETSLWLMGRFNFPESGVHGHYEVDPGKTCPDLDMDLFREALRSSAYRQRDIEQRSLRWNDRWKK